MILATGTRLGPYEILGPVGAGGMGEVYRAHDARLNRDVAIKVLPPSFSADSERLQRFELEAKAVGQLNHPNVLTVFDVGTHPSTDSGQGDGAPYMVTELLDGETLRQRLAAAAGTDARAQTGLGIRKAIDIARQIALGLAAAHGAGIVHRDLKPENVFVTRDGRVKILDFGLARMTERGGSEASLPTALQMTNPGTVLGTVGYMSPEQVRGKAADARSDLFALGAVLFELVGGRRAFDRDSSADTMAAILKEDPPELSASGITVPPALERLLRRCLEKNPDERFQSARDLAFAIEALDGSSASTTMSGTAPAASGKSRGRVGLIAMAAVTVTAAAVGGWWFGSQRGAAVVTRWDQFAQLTDEAGEEATPRISPDGASFAYSSRVKGTWDVYVQRVGGRQPIPVAADPLRHERWPAFSPDGKQIAFNETDGDGGIFIIGATGESERRLTDFGANPAWSPDSRTIVFAAEEVDMPYIRNGISSLWIVDVSGGAPRQLTKEDAVQPVFSPSGRRIAFWQAVAGQRDLVTMAADGTDRVLVTNDAPLDASPVWSPDGRYLYFASDRGGSMGLWRIGIDEATGRATGATESVSAGVEAWMDMPSFSSDGATLLFRSRLESVNPTAIAFDPNTERVGTPKILVSRTGVLNPTSVSRDGLWLALCNQGEAKEDLFVMRTDGTGLRRLTDDGARDRQPRWAPDDRTLLFYSNREGHYGAWSIRPDGSGLARLTAPTDFDLFYPSLSPTDGTMLITGDQGQSYLAAPPFPVSKDRLRKIQSIDVAGGVLQPSLWSPDGRYISGPVLARATSAPIGAGVYDVASAKAWKLTDDGGLWSVPFLPDSKRVIYLTSASELVVVDVATSKRRVIPVTLPFPVGVESFTVAPDGRTLYYGARRVEANVWKVSEGK